MVETGVKEYLIDDLRKYFIKLEEFDEGVKVSVPRECSEYNSNLQNEIFELEEGDVVRATLLSEDGSDWRFKDITDVKS